VSSRVEFLAALRAGLRGSPASAIDEIVADYTAHFDDGAAANRSEADIAAALGDPVALADELRINMRIDSFAAAPSPRSAARLFTAVLAFGTLNTFILIVGLPMLAVVTLASIGGICVFAAMGVWFLIAGTSLGLPGGLAVTVLCGLGLIAAALSLTAFLLLGAKLLVAGVGRHAQLNFRLLPRQSTNGKLP
jgi:uncharacterized membrane protein